VNRKAWEEIFQRGGGEGGMALDELLGIFFFFPFSLFRPWRNFTLHGARGEGLKILVSPASEESSLPASSANF